MPAIGTSDLVTEPIIFFAPVSIPLPNFLAPSTAPSIAPATDFVTLPTTFFAPVITFPAFFTIPPTISDTLLFAVTKADVIFSPNFAPVFKFSKNFFPPLIMLVTPPTNIGNSALLNFSLIYLAPVFTVSYPFFIISPKNPNIEEFFFDDTTFVLPVSPVLSEILVLLNKDAVFAINALFSFSKLLVELTAFSESSPASTNFFLFFSSSSAEFVN